MTQRDKPQLFRNTGYVEPSMKVLNVQCRFSGSTLSILSGSKSVVSASRDQAGIFKVWLQERFSTNFAVYKDSLILDNPFNAAANVLSVKLLEKNLTAADPYLKLGFHSGTIATGNQVAGSFIDPGSSYANLDFELTVKGNT